jgi:hypothetical protein
MALQAENTNNYKEEEDTDKRRRGDSGEIVRPIAFRHQLASFLCGL